jgi:hypothetical protein
MAKAIYKAAAMAKLWNQDVWCLLMPSEMIVFMSQFSLESW